MTNNSSDLDFDNLSSVTTCDEPVSYTHLDVYKRQVMAFPGGCVGGGVQPIHEGKEMAEIRSKNLYFLDSHNERRFSHENPEVLKTYEEYLEKPLSRMSHKLLHTDHHAWDMPLAPKLKKR